MKSSKITKTKRNKFLLFLYYLKSLILLLYILIKHPLRNIYFYQWEGMGDLSIALSYVPIHATIKKKKCFFCLYKKHKRYIPFFPFISNNVKYFDFQTLDNICVLCLRLFNNKKRIIVLNPNNYADLGIFNYDEISKYGWGEFTRDYILKIPYNFFNEIYYPKETIYANNLEIPNKSILINASSNTAPPLDHIFLGKVGVMLRRKGYSVFYNDNKNEKNHIFFSLDDILKNANKFAYIISVRSGLLDLLSGKNKNIIAINTTDEDNYSLRYNMTYWRNNGFSFLYTNQNAALKILDKIIN